MKKMCLVPLICIVLAANVSACSGILDFGKDKEASIEESKSKKKSSSDKKDDKEEDTQEEAVSEKEAAAAAQISVPEHSALDEGNLFGNTLCYARIIKVDDTLYFRNAFDNERLYSIDDGGVLRPAFGEIYPKDMQYKDGYIYYANTAKADMPSQDTDRNIYRLNVSTGVSERLTNISFDNSANDVWLSLDTLVGDYCYFTYYDGKGQGYHIACVNITNAQTGDLHIIPVDNCKGGPMPNIVDNKLYYRAKDGLNVLDISTGENALVIPGFSCTSYMIYDGKIFYTVGLEEGAANVSLMAGSLDAASSEHQVIYSSNEPVSIVDDIQFNIYGGNIYFITKSPNASDARNVSKLYRCKVSGEEVTLLEDMVTWFNIIDGDIYYKYANNDDVEFSRTQPMYRLTAGKSKVINETDDAKRKLLFAPEDFNKGWKASGRKWYYYDDNGNMLKSGWQTIDGNWYYFYDDGSMAINTTVESGGKVYQIDVDGKIYTYN